MFVLRSGIRVLCYPATLLSHNNIAYYQRLMRELRGGIERGEFAAVAARLRNVWG